MRDSISICSQCLFRVFRLRRLKSHGWACLSTSTSRLERTRVARSVRQIAGGALRPELDDLALAQAGDRSSLLSLFKQRSGLDQPERILRLLLALVKQRLEHLQPEFLQTVADGSLANRKGLEKAVARFNGHVNSLLKKPEDPAAKKFFEPLLCAFLARGTKGVDLELRQSCSLYVLRLLFSPSDQKQQKLLADFRFPVESFPGARTVQRTIHLHIGPTNSGKTYQALKRLMVADSGAYAGPLRLLAHEVYSRFNAQGKPCHLLTGDDKRTVEGHNVRMSSCTVEMVPLNTPLDVVVIDEIQNIGDPYRGWAWTHALLGVRAKEIHVCGEARAEPLIRQLADAMGDTLHVHKYERLSPLQVMDRSLEGDLGQLRKGDCLVTFSRHSVIDLRWAVQRLTGLKCATIYGALPPEVRIAQAQLFNDPNTDYDILIATDAIGMGLNLSIKRIVFATIRKKSNRGFQQLSVSEITQIAGRAGRYRLAGQRKTPTEEGATPLPPATNVGLVTTLYAQDLPPVQQAMTSPPLAILTAGLFPKEAVLQRFSAYFPPQTPFSVILRRLVELSRLHSCFHLCLPTEFLFVADVLDQFTRLTVGDRMTLCAAPTGSRTEAGTKVLKACARAIDRQQALALVDLAELELEVLEEPVVDNKDYLRRLETLNQGLVLYIWLSYRYSGLFTSRPLAFHVKKMVQERIGTVLRSFSSQESLAKKKNPPVRPRLDQKPSWLRTETPISHSPTSTPEIRITRINT